MATHGELFSASPEFLTRFRAGRLLARRKSVVIQEWELLCREKIAAARLKKTWALIDTLPLFLDQLCVTLEARDPKVEAETNSEIACEHGRERATVTNFSLDQMIYEYHLLRTILVKTLEVDGPLDSDVREILHEFVDRGIRKAAAKFSEIVSSQSAAARAELDFERHKFAQLFREFPAPLGLLRGPDLIFEIVNPAYAAAFTGRDVVGKTLLDAFPEIRGQPVPDIVRQVFASGEPFTGRGVLIQLKDPVTGAIEDRYFDLSYVRVNDRAGKPYGVYSYSIDVTRQVMAVREVERSRRQLHDFFMQAPQPMAIMEGPDFRFTIANAPFENLVGRSIIGKSILEVFSLSEVSAYIPILREVYRTGAPYSGKEARLDILDHAGAPRSHWLNFGYYPFRDESGGIRGIFAIVQDVTPEVESRKKIEENVRDLEQERLLRERFVAALTHDLRTPLTAAKLSAQVLARKAGDLAAVNVIAARIVGNMDRADGMITDLLDASRIKAGEPLPIGFAHCVLNRVVADTLTNLTLLHGDRFRLVADGEVTGFWSCDSLCRLIENLCSNAIKYGAENGVVTVTLSAAGNTASIRVHNDGPPIPAADQKNLFELFMRTESARKGKQKGWGIGLTLVRGIAEAHGGRVTVESSPERGTDFIVELPIDNHPRESS